MIFACVIWREFFSHENTPEGHTETHLKGLFAGGDIRIDAPKQVICAAGDGAIVGIQALEYVNN